MNASSNLPDDFDPDNYIGEEYSVSGKYSQDYPYIRSGFACLDDFVLITEKGNYVGPSFSRIFLNFLFIFLLGGVISTILDIGLFYLTMWNVPLADFLGKFMFIFHITIFLATIKFLPLTQYHSLEHKVANLIDGWKEINYDNVKNITGYSQHCGSNFIGLLVFYMLLLPILETIGVPVYLSVFGSVLFVLFTKIDKIFGKWIQEFFALKSPTEEQIEFAVKRGQDLMALSKEKKYIPYIHFKILMLGACAFTLAGFYRILLMTWLGGGA